MSKQSRVRWTPEERKHLRVVAVNRLHEYPGSDDKTLLKMGQNLLPDGRQRKLTPQVLFSMKDFFNDVRAEVAANPKVKKQPVQPLETPRPISNLEKSDSLEVVLNMLIDKLADKVADKVMFRLADQMQAMQPVEREYRPRHNPQPVVGATGECKPGVLVIGTLSHYAGTVKAAHPNLDITCVEAREGERRPYMMRAHTIMMTKFITHGVQYKYRKAANLKFCNGGMTELHEMLKKIEEQK